MANNPARAQKKENPQKGSKESSLNQLSIGWIHGSQMKTRRMISR